MTKIARYNGNLQAFASAAPGTERTIFGSISQANDLTSQINASFLRGWGIVGPSDQPALEDFNAAMYTSSQLLAYLHQMGVAEYNASQEYHLGSITTYLGLPYLSLINSNTGNTPSSSPLTWFGLLSSGRVEFANAGVTNWTVPIVMQLGFIKPMVYTTGAGGGGGGATSSTGAAGGGGGAGGTAFGFVDLTGVTSVAITLGTGGTGGTGAASGGNGGSSSFGSIMAAAGGSGGAGSSGASAYSGSGGSGVSGSFFHSPGGGGKLSLVVTGSFAAAGLGGDSYFGKGAGASITTGTAVSSVPGVAGAKGAGGSGGASYNATTVGGAGGPGYSVVEW